MPKMRTTLVLFRALNNKVDSKTRHCNVHETVFHIQDNNNNNNNDRLTAFDPGQPG